MRGKKGQLSIGSAPMIIMIVGLTFLVMATIALIGQKYGEAIPSSNTGTSTNETLTQAELTASTPIDNASACNFESLAVTQCVNATSGGVISTGNYTVGTNYIHNISFYAENWKCTYTFNYAGTACDINAELETNISENTSIAGIILTISLVGIILTLLIGVFLRIRTPRI